MRSSRRGKEHFLSTTINNRTGCAEAIEQYPCCDKSLFETISYPYENQNYDLEREVYDWGQCQYVPSLLAPKLKQYRESNPCYINTANPRSTLYANNCPQLKCDKKEGFSNPFPAYPYPPDMCSYINSATPQHKLIYGCNCSLCNKKRKDEKFTDGERHNDPYGCYTSHNTGVNFQENPPYCGYVYREKDGNLGCNQPSEIPYAYKIWQSLPPSILYDMPGYDSLI